MRLQHFPGFPLRHRVGDRRYSHAKFFVAIVKILIFKRKFISVKMMTPVYAIA
jgi:hypothetical protein